MAAQHAVHVARHKRLVDVVVHAHLEAVPVVIDLVARAHGHDGHGCPALAHLQFADASRGFDAAHLWHVEIHQHEIRFMHRQPFERTQPVLRHDHLQPQAFKRALCNQCVDWVVLDHQHTSGQVQGAFLVTETLLLQVCVGQFIRWAMRSGQGQGERERGADAHPAFAVQLAAHGHTNLLGDAQAQPRAPHLVVVAGIDLVKGVEDLFDVRFGNASARVLHLEDNVADAIVGRRDALVSQSKSDHDMPLRRELDGVAHQVREDLPQAIRVGLQPQVIGQAGAQHHHQPLVPRRDLGQFAHMAGQFIEQHRPGVQAQPMVLEPREVQHIVDHFQQVLARVVEQAHLRQVFRLPQPGSEHA